MQPTAPLSCQLPARSAFDTERVHQDLSWTTAPPLAHIAIYALCGDECLKPGTTHAATTWFRNLLPPSQHQLANTYSRGPSDQSTLVPSFSLCSTLLVLHLPSLCRYFALFFPNCPDFTCVRRADSVEKMSSVRMYEQSLANHHYIRSRLCDQVPSNRRPTSTL